MLRSNRRDIFAVGLSALAAAAIAAALWWSASSQHSEYRHTADNRAAQYADAGRVEAKNCVALPISQRANCKSQAYERAREGQRKEYDLEAQRVTAVWTQHMGIAAMIGIAVSIVGVGLVWTTFRETRLANSIAKRAADSAADDARKSRNALIASDRAIMSVDSIGQQTNVPDDSPWVDFYFKLNNQGKSNAYGFQIFFSFSFDAVFRAKTRFSHNIDQICASGAQAQYPVKVRRPTTYPTHIIGYVSYSTMGDANFKTFFCFRIDGPPVRTGTGNYEHLYLERVDCEGLPALS